MHWKFVLPYASCGGVIKQTDYKKDHYWAHIHVILFDPFNG